MITAAYEPRLDPPETAPQLAERLDAHERTRAVFLEHIADARRQLYGWQLKGIDEDILEQLLDAAERLAEIVEPSIF